MIRSASTAFVLALCCLAALPAEARKKAKPVDAESSDDSGAGSSKTSKSAKADKPDSGKPVQIASFGDWGAYLAKGKGKTCYTLASPKERKPDIKRPAAYVFIADRPAEKVKNEVSIIMGFPMKESAPAQAKVGTTSFDLVAKGANAWIKDPADESKFVESLRHAAKLVVKAVPTHGPGTTDTYVLTGFKQALDRVTKGMQVSLRACNEAPGFRCLLDLATDDLSGGPRRADDHSVAHAGPRADTGWTKVIIALLVRRGATGA